MDQSVIVGRNKHGDVHEDVTDPSRVSQEAYFRASKIVGETELDQKVDISRLTDAHASSSKINVGDAGESNALKMFPDVSSLGK